MKPSILRRAFLAGVIAAVSLVRPAVGFVVDGGPYWTGSRVTLQLKLGSSPTYGDGTNPNSTAIEAAKEWNPYMGRLQLATSSATTGKGSSGNKSNEVFFSTDIYGEAFGSNVLAVTLIHTTSKQRTEADVIVNQTESWGSYRGPLQYQKTDLRRVLAHEFGHVLGLDHPDEAGQYVSSLMNAYVSDTEAPTTDDQDGVASLYGNGVANPPIPPRISSYLPYDVTVYEGQAAGFSVDLNYDASRPVTYQWRKNGSAIKGATGSDFRIEAAKTGDAGLYSVVVKNAGGSVTSREAVLTVNPAELPTVTISASNSSIYLGSSVYFNTYVSGGTAPFSYQWERDGQPIPGETSSMLDFNSVKPDQAGIYDIVVTNAAGSVRSNDFSLVVLPIPLPVESTISADYGNPYTLRLSPWIWLEDAKGPYTYQWYRNGQPIAGAIDSNYTIPSEWKRAQADYVLIVTNPTGSTASQTYNFTPPAADTSVNSGGWIQTERFGDIAYFLFANPARIERYDLTHEQWLSALVLPRKPTSFRPDDSGLYVAFGRAVSRFKLDGTGETSIVAMPEDVQGLFVRDGTLIVFHPQTYVYSKFSSVRLSDESIIDEKSYTYGMTKPGSLSIAPRRGFIYGRDSGLSPADLHVLTLNADGSFGGQTDSPYHGDYADAQRTFVSPDESLLVEDSGNVYATADLTHVGSIGDTFDDMAFTDAGTAVVLRGAQLIAYDAKLDESGSATVGSGATRLFLNGQNAYLFAPPAGSGKSITVDRVDLTSLHARPAFATVDPTGLDYTPSEILLGEDRVVYLLARAQGNVFRWSVDDRRYRSSIPLTGSAEFLTYSATNNALYAAFVDHRISKVPLAETATEVPFTSMSANILGLSTAGRYVFASDATSPWTSYYTFDAQGNLLARKAWSYQSRVFVWSDVKRRLYHFRDDSSPNDLIYTEVLDDGTFGQEVDSPYHGEIDIRYPICVSPSGDTILLGSGVFYDADTLQQNNALPVDIDGAAWLGSQLFTARSIVGGTRIERWGGSNYGLDASTTIPGTFLKMFSLPPDKFLVIVEEGDAPLFVTFDSDLASDLPANTAPTVSAIGNQTIAINELSPDIDFSIDDAETKPSKLKLSWQSSSSTLIPLSGIVVSGTGSTRKVRIRPSTGETGSAKVTLTVSDGNLSTSTSFRVTVQNRPGISEIADQATSEDKTLGPVPFTVGCTGVSAAKLVMSATSSNTGIVPNGNVTFGGSGTNRTFRVKPAANKNGSVMITLRVTAGGLDATTKFKVTIKAINDAPTISPVGSQIVSRNTTSGAIAFQVADLETSASKLTVVATSSDSTLIPSSSIALSGADTNRTLRIRPATNRTGSARITLTVSDGSLKAQTSFELRVNSPPTITKIANQRITEGKTTKPLTFTIGDSETSTSELKLTKSSSNVNLIPLSGIVLGGSGAHRTVRVTPAKGKTGSAKVTLQVSDGDGAATITFWVIVSKASS